jgi:hypothetical protein
MPRPSGLLSRTLASRESVLRRNMLDSLASSEPLSRRFLGQLIRPPERDKLTRRQLLRWPALSQPVRAA